MAECFQIAAADNVATLLMDTEPGAIAVRGERQAREIPVTEPIRMGNKVALCGMLEGTITLDGAAQELAELVHEVASGAKTKPEQLGHREFFIMYKHQDTPSLEAGCRHAGTTVWIAGGYRLGGGVSLLARHLSSTEFCCRWMAE